MVNKNYDMDLHPWQHPPETYSLAITGKAFNHLVKSPSDQATLHRVLFKAQIYARMSPEDKAALVEQL
jgi:magnesium-transporting ATPase (P-type)